MPESEELRKKLKEVAELEQGKKVIGINFAVKKGAKLSAGQSVDYVLALLKNSEKFLSDRRK